MTQIMSQTNIPIRFRFLRIPTTWEIRTVRGQGNRTAQFAFGVPEGKVGSVSALDAWKCREEFLEIADNDNESLLRFLAKVGEWHRPAGEQLGHWSSEVMQHYRQGNPMPVDVR